MSMYDGLPILAKATSVNLNSVADTAIDLPIGGGRKYHFEVIVTNSSANLSGGSLQYGLFSSTGGSGTILAAGVNSATSLTAAAKAIKVAGTDTATTNGTIYFRVSVANGTAATADVYIVGYPLP